MTCNCLWVTYSAVCNGTIKDMMPNIKKTCNHLVQTGPIESMSEPRRDLQNGKGIALKAASGN